MHQQQTAFENIVGKGEIVCIEQFLFFPQYFLLNQIIVSTFVHIFDIISLCAAELEEYKIGISGKGLMGFFLFFYQTVQYFTFVHHCCMFKQLRFHSVYNDLY